MKKIMFVQHVNPHLPTVFKATITWESEDKWIGTIAGIYQELPKTLWKEVASDAYDKQFSSCFLATDATLSKQSATIKSE